MKPGWKTTEFWVTVAAQVIAVLVVFGVVARADAETLSSAITQLVGGLFALVTSGVSIWKYIQSRLETKKADIERLTAIEAYRATEK